MFRALLVGLGSMCLIALVVVGLRQIDLSALSAAFASEAKETSPILTQADGDARYVQPGQLDGQIGSLRQALETERDRRQTIADEAAQLRLAQQGLQRELAALRQELTALPKAAAVQPAPAALSPAPLRVDTALQSRVDALEGELRAAQRVIQSQEGLQATLGQQLRQLSGQFAAAAQKLDSTDGAQAEILQTVRVLQTDLKSLQAQLNALTQPTLAVAPPAQADPAVAAPAPPAILERSPGWLVSLHPTTGHAGEHKESPLLGRMVLEKYPFSTGDHLSQFPVSDNMTYRGQGHLSIPSDGTYVFSVSANGRDVRFRQEPAVCAVKVTLGDELLFNLPRFGVNQGMERVFTQSITLKRGEYDLSTSHYCARRNFSEFEKVSFDFRVLYPGGLNPEPIPAGDLYYKMTQ